MKLAHLADLHLGFRQYERQTPKGGNQREADVAEGFRRAVDDLLEQRPDLIVIAGDVFHSVRPTNQAILFLFQQLQRIRTALPDVPIVMIAGDHDTPRSTETTPILRLYDTLGVEVAADQPRRLLFPRLDCAVLAVPHQPLVTVGRPALRPEPGVTRNVLVVHGEVEGILPADPVPLDFGGAVLTREDLAPAQWDYVALGHYHVPHEVAANAWYAGSLDFVGTAPWRELRLQQDHKRGKGYLLVNLPGAHVTFREVSPRRSFVDLNPIQGAGLTAREIDVRIRATVESAEPIDGKVLRLVVYDVSRGTARDLDHAAIRAYKGRALQFVLDVRRPAPARPVGVGAPGGQRQSLGETVREFLARRPLDADLDRDDFVRLGARYFEDAAAPDAGGNGAGA